MNYTGNSKLITAIDIGTTKICVLVAEAKPESSIEIIGVTQYPSHGLKKGVLVNMAETSRSIKMAIQEAEILIGAPIKEAVVGISGSHIQSFNSKGVVPIDSHEVTQRDIDNVISVAKAVSIPEDREILHVIPRHFIIDGHEVVLDATGMCGVRLEAQVHIVTGSISSAQNIIKACRLAGISPSDVVLEQIASAEAVLSPSERELGTAILDIGGGTSDLAIYKNNGVVYSKVFPVAGNHFTNDLAVGLGIPIKLAEETKHKYGFVTKKSAQDLDSQHIEVKKEDEGIDKLVDHKEFYEVLNPRACELLEMAMDEIVRSKLGAVLQTGLVLTGGGSLLNGMDDLARQIFSSHVRVGYPNKFEFTSLTSEIPENLKSPIYSTGYGLLLYAAKGGDQPFRKNYWENGGGSILNKMKSWLYEFF